MTDSPPEITEDQLNGPRTIIQRGDPSYVSTKCGLSLHSYQDDPPVPINWVISGILPTESCVIIGGEEKARKTFVTFDLALCLSSGQSFLNRFAPRRTGKTLLYSPEGSPGARRRRLYGGCWGRGLNPRETLKDIIFCDTRLNLTHKPDLDKLRQAIDEIEPKMLVIDPLISVAGGVDENNSSDMQALLDGIRDAGKGYTELGIIIVHHRNKGHKERSAHHKLRGSSAIGGWTDGLIQVWKPEEGDEDGPSGISFHHRDAPAPKPDSFAIIDGNGEIDGINSIRLDAMGPIAASEPAAEGICQGIVTVLKVKGRSMKQSELAKELNVYDNKIRRALTKLTAQNVVELGFDRKIHLCKN